MGPRVRPPLPANRRARTWGEIALATAAAATLSGLPSTTWAVITGGGILDATRAAGTLIPGRRDRPSLVGGVVSHIVVSSFWTTVIATAAPRHRRLRPREGAAAGLLIAALDLGLIGRHYPAISALPAVPQWIDHAAFGALAAACLSRDTSTAWPERYRCSGLDESNRHPASHRARWLP